MWKKLQKANVNKLTPNERNNMLKWLGFFCARLIIYRLNVIDHKCDIFAPKQCSL